MKYSITFCYDVLTANTNQPVAKLFRNQVTESPWDTLLSSEELISSGDFEQFVRDYMEDFINMVYRFRTNDDESRHLEAKVT